MFAASSNNKNAVKTTMCLDGMDSALISHRNCFLGIREGEQRDEANKCRHRYVPVDYFCLWRSDRMVSQEGKVLIEIPREDYDLFIAACDTTSREYIVLKNSIILDFPTVDPKLHIVQIMYNEDEALKLLYISVQQCHEVTDRIGAAIDRARKFNSN